MIDTGCTDTILTNEFPLFFGHQDKGKYVYEGFLKEVSVYNKVLTDQEIMDKYNQKFDNKDNLIGYWLLNGGSGKIIKDNSKRGNNAIIHNGIWNKE